MQPSREFRQDGGQNPITFFSRKMASYILHTGIPAFLTMMLMPHIFDGSISFL